MMFWMVPTWCSAVRGHVFSWSAGMAPDATVPPQGIRCACGGYVWFNGVAMPVAEVLIA